MFSAPLEASADTYLRLADPYDPVAPLADRARAYLETNCAHCHMPGGTALGGLDLRYVTSIEAMQACGVAPSEGDLGMAGALVIDAGHPERSVLSLRMHSLAEGDRMPPLATSVVDTVGVQVIDAWITSMTGCGG